MSEVKSVFVDSKGNVYVAGFTQDESDATFAKVWKNGEDYPLDVEGITDSETYSIFVTEDGTVYVAGIFYYVEFSSHAISRRAKVWKNGEDYPLGTKEDTEEDFGISFPLSLYLDEKGSVYVGVLKSGVSKDAHCSIGGWGKYNVLKN